MPRTKTIGEHFAHHSEFGVDIEDITMGLFGEEMERECEAADVDLLLDLCNDVIQDWGVRPYLGSKTHGSVMLEVMQRFSAKTGRNVPAWWYSTAKKLWARYAEEVA